MKVHLQLLLLLIKIEKKNLLNVRKGMKILWAGKERKRSEIDWESRRGMDFGN